MEKPRGTRVRIYPPLVQWRILSFPDLVTTKLQETHQTPSTVTGLNPLGPGNECRQRQSQGRTRVDTVTPTSMRIPRTVRSHRVLVSEGRTDTKSRRTTASLCSTFSGNGRSVRSCFTRHRRTFTRTSSGDEDSPLNPKRG